METERHASSPPVSGTLTVSKQEWEQIDQVPPHTRAVGALFQAAAEVLRGKAATKKKKLVFSAKAYKDVSGAVTAPSAKTGKSKASDIKGRCLEATLKQDRERAIVASRAALPPRREAFGARCESFVYAALLWLRNLPELPRAVAAKKFIVWLDANVDGCDERVVAELRRMTAPSDALAALELLCEAEELLACDVCAAELALREEQAEVVRAVRAACLAQRPLLLKYKTPPSGGKSSASALLGASLADLKDCYVIYACYSRPVRLDVCKHLVATCVPFAIAVQGVASPSYNCFFGKPKKPHAPPPPDLASRAAYSLRVCRGCDRPPVVIVCDLQSTILFLSQRQQDVLLFDEPTADLASGMRRDVRSILRLAPRVTVLMSATVPDFGAIGGFVAAFEARHPGTTLLAVDNERLSTSVTATTAEGLVLAPHALGATLQEIRGSGHLRRFYAPRVLQALRPSAEELAFEDLLSYGSIRDACLRILAARGEAPLASPPSRPALDLRLCCTAHAQFLPGATLVVLEQPASFEAAVEANLDGVASFRRLVKAADAAKRAEERQGAQRDRDARGREEEAKGGWEDAERRLLEPRYVVNSRQHLLRFAAALERFPERLQRAPLLLPEDVLASSNERVLEAALCGVLFVNNGLCDAAFEAVAQTLAEKAAESFFVGDRALVYGLNLPFDRLVVACGGLSRPELQQLCGRVGRTCRASSRAEIVFLDADVARKAMTLGDDGDASCTQLFDVAETRGM